jgi:hypothetical protein
LTDGLLGTNIPMNLDNIFNLVYYGSMFFGNTSQEAPYSIFDTSFKGVAVTSTSCANCTFPFFDPSASTTFVGNSSALVNLTYQGETLTGFYGTDLVSLSIPSSAVTMEFFVITDAPLSM